MKHLITASIVGFSFALLVGCGGGGDSGSGSLGGPEIVPAVSSSTFSVDAAYKNNLSASRNLSWKLVGTVQTIAVTGTGTWVESGLSATTFNGQPAQLRTIKTNGTLITLGQSTPLVINQNVYYDSGFRNVGSSGTAGSNYQTMTFSVLPTTAKIGDSGLLAIIKSYSDVAKLNKISTGTTSWVLSADSATTAILKITTALVTPTGVGNLTTFESVRVSTTGETTKVTFESLGIDQMLKFSF